MKIFALFLYIILLVTIGLASCRKKRGANDYLIGKRSLNSYLTAMSAHASDMSHWLFLGLPAAIATTGLFHAWFAFGLILFMFLNWQLVAPKIRVQTERYDSLTLSSFFESRFSDTSGVMRLLTAFMSLIFYTIYIGSGIIGIGILTNSLFNIPYLLGISVGTLAILPYLLIGGYTTLARVDLFQALFLLIVIVTIPLLCLKQLGGLAITQHLLETTGVSLQLFPKSPRETLMAFFLLTSWGLGYFGQPHIVTKFMGIKHVSEVRRAKWIGMSWQTLIVIAAIAIGLIGVVFVPNSLEDPEKIFIKMTLLLFHPFISALMLCGVLAATISTIDSQILVLATILSEDVYKKMIDKDISDKGLLTVSRICVCIIAAFAYFIALFKVNTIYSLVSFAWNGLGCCFGPLLLFSLYGKKVNRYGAWGGIAIGGITALLWPVFALQRTSIPTLLPGFAFSALTIYSVSLLTQKRAVCS